MVVPKLRFDVSLVPHSLSGTDMVQEILCVAPLHRVSDQTPILKAG